MTENDRLQDLLRSALPPAAGQAPSRDLWPFVVERLEAPVVWSWLDVSLVAAVSVVLLMFPEGAWLLAYHL